jgi:hypothetical protein
MLDAAWTPVRRLIRILGLATLTFGVVLTCWGSHLEIHRHNRDPLQTRVTYEDTLQYANEVFIEGLVGLGLGIAILAVCRDPGRPFKLGANREKVSAPDTGRRS